ncbi:MAG: endonuclease [Desulfobacteraceae bacterium]|nr:endonuclease [Desulfobacteraceae bacterium]MBC2749155.1 endonuclease/exonuclease/phosphatase family protein [Desulfobacteraceae bacterium]
MALRIATYNIHRCIGRDGDENPERIAAVLRELDADLVALQEVAFDPDAPGNRLRFLADATGAQAIPGPTLLEAKGRYGNALLSRRTVRQVRRIDISVPGREPRGVIQIVLEIRRKTVVIIATHLGLSFEERRYQIGRIVSLLESSPPADVTILMGDFNEWLRWGRMRRRLKRVFDAFPAPATFPSRRPLLALDQIWVRPTGVLTAMKVNGSASARMASDHLPLLADLAL